MLAICTSMYIPHLYLVTTIPNSVSEFHNKLLHINQKVQEGELKKKTN